MDYLASLAAGLLIGAIYALARVRSPAPPPNALLGLLAMGMTYTLWETAT